MDISDTAKAQVVSAELSRQYNVLECAVGTVALLKRLLADYERLEAERNDFGREHARILVENGTLVSRPKKR
jgi:hypothetical protein